MGASDSKLRRSHWAPDDSANACGRCDAPFGVARRRHHCRSCGQLFCDGCSRWKAHDPQFMPDGTVDRVCAICYDVLTGVSSARPTTKAGGNGAAAAGPSGLLGGPGSSGSNGAGGEPSRRMGPVVVAEADTTADDAADDAPDPQELTGTARFEMALNDANARFVDVTGCGVRHAEMEEERKMDNGNLEGALRAAGGVAHLAPPVTIEWARHAMASMDASATLFGVQRELPDAIVALHAELGAAAGIQAPVAPVFAMTPVDGAGGAAATADSSANAAQQRVST